MEKLFRDFIAAIDSYAENVAFDNKVAASIDRDEIVALFIRACMTDFKHDKEV